MSSQPFHSLSLNQIIKSKRTLRRHGKKKYRGCPNDWGFSLTHETWFKFFHDHPLRDHPFEDNREEVVTSRCHGSKISGSQLTVVLQIWQRKKRTKLTCMTFLCTIRLGNKTVIRTSLQSFHARKIVEIQEFCSLGNVTSYEGLNGVVAFTVIG